MDLLDCQTGSRCFECHHYSASSGCALLASLAAYEASLARPAPRAASPPTLAWAGARDALTLAEA